MRFARRDGSLFGPITQPQLPQLLAMPNGIHTARGRQDKRDTASVGYSTIEMDMEELLGLDAGDFEGVEFAESSDSDNEQDASDGRRGVAAAAETNDSTAREDGAIAAPAAPVPPSGTTTVIKVRGVLKAAVNWMG